MCCNSLLLRLANSGDVGSQDHVPKIKVESMNHWRANRLLADFHFYRSNFEAEAGVTATEAGTTGKMHIIVRLCLHSVVLTERESFIHGSILWEPMFPSCLEVIPFWWLQTIQHLHFSRFWGPKVKDTSKTTVSANRLSKLVFFAPGLRGLTGARSWKGEPPSPDALNNILTKRPWLCLLQGPAPPKKIPNKTHVSGARTKFGQSTCGAGLLTVESLSNALADKLLACNGQEGDWAGLDGLHSTVHCTGLHFSSLFRFNLMLVLGWKGGAINPAITRGRN